MHHKRRRPKNRRGGCLMCKPHKQNGAGSARECENRPQLLRAKATWRAYREGRE